MEFEDEPGKSKRRPVIIVDGRGIICTTLKVTSQKKDDPNHVKLSQWQAAGLSKQSWVDVSRTVPISEESLNDFIGNVDYADIIRIRKRLD